MRVSFHSCVIADSNSLSRPYVFVNTNCLTNDVVYTEVVPNLWNETIEAHRAAVCDAILDTTAALVAEHGLRSATMSQIAKKTGIGRATLYKYFPDVEAILLAWHERQITGHLEHLAELRDQTSDAGERLEAVLEAYALILHESRGHHDTELAAFLHRDEQVARAQQHLRDMIRDVLAEGAVTGDVRDDVVPDELASYCLHALTAASRIRLRSAGSSQSPWRGCAPRAESFKEGDLLAWAGGWLCRLRVSRLGAREETTATVAPHQGSYDERPQGHENYGHQPGDRVE